MPIVGTPEGSDQGPGRTLCPGGARNPFHTCWSLSHQNFDQDGLRPQEAPLGSLVSEGHLPSLDHPSFDLAEGAGQATWEGRCPHLKLGQGSPLLPCGISAATLRGVGLCPEHGRGQDQEVPENGRVGDLEGPCVGGARVQGNFLRI